MKVNEAFRNRKGCRLTCTDYQEKTREKYVGASYKQSAISRLRNWKTQYNPLLKRAQQNCMNLLGQGNTNIIYIAKF